MEESVNMKEEENKKLEEIRALICTPMDTTGAKGLSPLVLAYIGDAVFENYIRRYLIGIHRTQVNHLHKMATRYVKAEAQAKMVHFLMDTLDEEERTIVKRGRNTKSNTSPKNASLSHYRYATGFEALVGFLYLTGEKERLLEIISRSIKYMEKRDMG